MKFTVGVAVLLLLGAFSSRVDGQAVPVVYQSNGATAQESLKVGRGDLLHITIFREPDMEQKVRVKDSGEIDLDLAGTLKVAGQTPSEAARMIAQQYVNGQFLNHPQVSVLIEEYATQNVSVLGEVKKPGAFPLTTPRDLLDVLALAGGLTEIADRHITVQRVDKAGVEKAFLPNNPSTDLRQAGVIVYPGDTILVPKAGLVYVMGDVSRPGGYVMQDDAKITILQAVAMAAGANKTAKEDDTRLIRKANGSYQDSIVPLKDIEEGKQPDKELQADDVLYIPFSMTKHVILATAGIVSSTTAAAIYATR
ncbi:polysaccharide biosynthesis/export family protein [Acidobacterium sp. S8]|uniref:polysaccharide biosynthesis/export family protein n=1 Tax=Acidobacterium sp. S8 TaxID=1641854 RepID=UPI00131E59C9|nr:polysaccharide biosynthesis/export family protein [Acidobacterium sp. S8]